LPSVQADGRPELAGGEGIESAEAAREFGGGQAALAVEAAEEIGGEPRPFLRVTFHTAGDEIAVGIAPRLHAWNDMIETLRCAGDPAQTVKAETALAGVDGIAQWLGLEKIRLFEAGSARHSGWAAFIGSIGTDRANLSWQTHFDYMTVSAAFHQAQGTLSSKPADGFSHRPAGDTSTAGEPGNGKAEPKLPFEAAMPQKMRIDSAVDDRQVKLRDDEVFQLFPDEFSIRFFVFHGSGPEHASAGAPAAKGDLRQPGQRKKRTEAGAERPLKGKNSQHIALSEGVEPERTGQAARKKVKGKLSGDNLPQELRYQIGGALQEKFFSCSGSPAYLQLEQFP
jgi:hypothetical protein